MDPVTVKDAGVSPTTWKFIFIAAVFVITFVSSLLPLRIVSNLRNVLDPDKRAQYVRLVSALNCFGGGVFFGTAFLDLLPKIKSLMKGALLNSSFPFAEFVVSFGFLLILSVEQIAIDCKERTSDCRNPIERLQTRNVQLERETLTVNVQEEGTSSSKSATLQPREENPNKSTNSAFHALFLVAALSLHSLFEGLAIGLLQSVDVVIQICFAILIHKVPVAFSIGLTLVQCELKIPAVIQLNLWFSLMSPLGAGIGMVLLAQSSITQVDLLNGVLVGLTTGTFIFVIFFEIIPKELKKGKGRVLNLLFTIVGFSCVCIAILFETKHPLLDSNI